LSEKSVALQRGVSERHDEVRLAGEETRKREKSREAAELPRFSIV